MIWYYNDTEFNLYLLIKINTCLEQKLIFNPIPQQNLVNLTTFPNLTNMNEITTTLNDFLVNTKSSAALILNGKGKLITSLHLDYADSVAAMSAAILSMSEKLLIDLDKGALKQLFLKTSEGVVIGNKISGTNFLIAFSRDGSNLGLLMRSTDEVALELSKNSLLK
jgi:predicted regulator of Ras-like GTPase activity (Roadblock/LC7/MglB family)